MERDYQAGTVSALAFAGFYVSTLAGRTPLQWQALRAAFVQDVVAVHPEERLAAEAARLGWPVLCLHGSA